MPSTSLVRRWRVVTEIESVRSSALSCSNWRVSVVLPAPEGEERISISPRRWIAPCGFRSAARAASVIGLPFAIGSFDFGRNDARGDFRGVGLGSDGIAFAEHFLGEEVEGAAVGALGSQTFAELLEVALEPAELLRDIGAIGKERQLAGQTFVIGGKPRCLAVTEGASLPMAAV